MKKIILFTPFLFLINFAIAQSVDVGSDYIQIKTNNSSALSLYRINNGGARNPTGIRFGSYDNGSFSINGSISVKPFEFAQNINGFGSFKFSTGFGESMNITYNNVTHNVFTKLGADAPAIKTIKITTTTAAAQGVQTTIPHGLTASKILGIQAMVKQNIVDFIPPSHDATAGTWYDVKISGPDIVIFNKAGSSSNILSKAISILITYEE
jgi:hypothetical protein